MQTHSSRHNSIIKVKVCDTVAAAVEVPFDSDYEWTNGTSL